MIEYGRPDGQQTHGYFSAAQHHKGLPAVIMVEEWWGITDHIKKTADDLASAGFRVLVPDLFRGRVAATGDEANHMLQGLDFNDAVTQDIRGAIECMREDGKVGVIGFCVGGQLAVLTAVKFPGVDAVVSFYGYPPPDEVDADAIKAPFQGHWATKDAFYTIDGVEKIEKRLKEAGTPYEFYRYDAEHGFHNPNQPGHSGLGHFNEEYAKLAWQRTIDFFKRTLAK